jgi:hypothetical protein
MVTLISFANYKQYFVYYLKKHLLSWKAGFLSHVTIDFMHFRLQ